MLSEVFPRRYRVYQQSPFVQDLDSFSAWLMEAGYTRVCARAHVFRLKCVLERMTRAEPDATYTEAQLHAAFGVKHTSAKRRALFRATERAYQRFLSSQNRLARAPLDDPFARLRSDYRRYLAELRALSSATIRHHEITVTDFLQHALRSNQPLCGLSHADIEAYLRLKTNAVGRGRLQHIIAHLRAFLHYCHSRGAIHSRLDVIDTPRTYQDELPPRALKWSVVQALLHSIDRSSRSGWRDYAILHLMAHYGLRPSEIVTLQLQCIDWTAKSLQVEQRKTRSALILPLARQTVSVLRRYLDQARPSSSHPQLFLRARCPAGALKRYAVTDIFKKRAAQSGLMLEGHSVYCLRHSFAMRLLQRGVGIKAIGDLLGHRTLASTGVYLRLDVDMLRGAALPVPKQVRGGRHA
jgi:site-specific recombinase XerD